VPTTTRKEEVTLAGIAAVIRHVLREDRAEVRTVYEDADVVIFGVTKEGVALSLSLTLTE
jgi:ABC-type branched-subunit amino acid transport system substrate-binding protein